MASNRRFAIALLLGLMLGAASGADAQTGDRTTPLGMAPGAPAGSYPLSDLERINLFNGSMSFYLPLLSIGGRGEAGYAVGLLIERHWGVQPVSALDPRLKPRFDWYRGFRPGFSPGHLKSYRDKDKPGGGVMYYLTRLTFTAPDGTQQELRDTATEGTPTANSDEGRGTDFHTSDGTAAIFHSDGVINGPGPVTGNLFFRDGRRYRIEGGKVMSIRDRNGNLTTFQYGGYDVEEQVTQATDATGRVYRFAYVRTESSLTETIDFKGYGNSDRQIRVEHALHSTALVAGEEMESLGQLFPNLDWQEPGRVVDLVLPVRAVIPDGREYGFRYNRYGELAEVTLPTGAVVRYEYQGGSFGDAIYRRSSSKSVFAPNGTALLKTDFSGEQANGANQYVDERRLDATTGAVASTTRHHFYGHASDELVSPPFYYPHWTTGREYLTEIYAPSGGALRTIANTWQQRYPLPPSAPDKLNDPRIIETRTTLDNGLVSKQTFTYDEYNNRTGSIEHDYGAGQPGPPVSGTTTAYFTSYVNDPDHPIRNLPLQESLYDYGTNGSPVLRASTTYEYDNYSASAPNAPLAARSGIVSLDPEYKTPGFVNGRGNATKVSRSLDIPGGSVDEYRNYDVAGNVLRIVDPRGYATSFDFSDNFGAPDSEASTNSAPGELNGALTWAYSTRVTNALGHETRTQYDYHLGQPVNHQDANGVVGSIAYDDALGRPTETITSYGDTATMRRTTFSYSDAGPNPQVDTAADKDGYGDGTLKSRIFYDSVGREMSRQFDEAPGQWITHDGKAYDGLGRVQTVWNPFRPNGAEQAGATTTTYDALDRPVIVELPGGSKTIATYVGNVTTVEDAAGTAGAKRGSTTTDALGRIVSVTEDPGGLGYVTTYAYDAFGNVVKVTQGGQVRTFKYDSLSRLICASNPESRAGATSCAGALPSSGVDLYSYDGNGNVTRKTDARGAWTAFTYDPLNRLGDKTYSDPTMTRVGFSYDSAVNGKGRPAAMWSEVENKIWGRGTDEYDRVGRVRKDRHVLGDVHRAMEYTYDLAGNLRTERYPSGRTVTMTYDGAGRMRQINEGTYLFARTAQASDNADGYTAHGAVTRRLLGNGLWQRADFNCRLQQRLAGLGVFVTTAELVAIHTNYGTNSSCTVDPASQANNGNLLSQTIQIQAPWASPAATLTQTYGYDGVNRLTQVSETTNLPGGMPWSQTFGYDRWGNRTVTGTVYDAQLTPTAFDANTNRISGGAWAYDSAGNLTTDGRSRTFTYDAEGRQTRAGNVHYFYDGHGHRVKKVDGTTVTTYAYDAFGRMVAEYGPSTQLGTHFITADHLGSTRLITDERGNVVSRMDYLPFGELVSVAPTNYGGRDNIEGYGVDWAVRQKFTGKERDFESGLDYFQARYYSGPQGRFAARDPESAGAVVENPQTWAGYAYVGNQPLTLVDPFGLAACDAGDQGTVRCAEQVTVTATVRRNVFYVNFFDRAAWADAFGPGLWPALRGAFNSFRADHSSIPIVSMPTNPTDVVLTIGGVRTGGKLAELGLGGIRLAGRSYNSGRKALEEAGFKLLSTTRTGRKIFRHPTTGATVTYDSGRALTAQQRPHWTIQDRSGQFFDRSGRPVSGPNPPMGGKHIPGR